MSKKQCQICGAIEPGTFDKLRGIGLAFKIKTCLSCGLVYCTNCAVAKKKSHIRTAMTIPILATSLASCPHCYPNGFRGKGSVSMSSDPFS